MTGIKSQETELCEMKRLFFSVIDATLLELTTHFGERCKPIYTALATRNAKFDDFLSLEKMKALLNLISDSVNELELFHETQVAQPLIISQNCINSEDVFNNIASLQRFMLTYNEAYPQVYKVLACVQTIGALTAVFFNLNTHAYTV